jgi:hypothetical protein
MMKNLLIVLTTILLVGSASAQRCNKTPGTGPDPALAPSWNKLMKAADAVRGAKTPQSSAEAWFRLNLMADQFAEALNHVSSAKADEDPEDCAELRSGLERWVYPSFFARTANSGLQETKATLSITSSIPVGPGLKMRGGLASLGINLRTALIMRAQKMKASITLPSTEIF